MFDMRKVVVGSASLVAIGLFERREWYGRNGRGGRWRRGTAARPQATDTNLVNRTPRRRRWHRRMAADHDSAGATGRRSTACGATAVRSRRWRRGHDRAWASRWSRWAAIGAATGAAGANMGICWRCARRDRIVTTASAASPCRHDRRDGRRRRQRGRHRTAAERSRRRDLARWWTARAVLVRGPECSASTSSFVAALLCGNDQAAVRRRRRAIVAGAAIRAWSARRNRTLQSMLNDPRRTSARCGIARPARRAERLTRSCSVALRDSRAVRKRRMATMSAV